MTSVTVTSYSKAMSILSEIGNGKCTDKCKSTSIRKIKYALKSVSNPLMLTRYTRRKLTQKIALVSGKNAVNEYSKTKKNIENENHHLIQQIKIVAKRW